MIKKLWSKKEFRIFIWTSFNALVAFLWTQLVLPEYVMYSPFLIPLLNMITKYVNTKWFGDIWVTQEQ